MDLLDCTSLVKGKLYLKISDIMPWMDDIWHGSSGEEVATKYESSVAISNQMTNIIIYDSKQLYSQNRIYFKTSNAQRTPCLSKSAPLSSSIQGAKNHHIRMDLLTFHHRHQLKCCWPIPHFHCTSIQLMGNWWFGFLVSSYERDCCLGAPLKSQTTNFPWVDPFEAQQKPSCYCEWPKRTCHISTSQQLAVNWMVTNPL